MIGAALFGAALTTGLNVVAGTGTVVFAILAVAVPGRADRT
ncbi:hypothetical protein [Nonomuraea longicatena]